MALIDGLQRTEPFGLITLRVAGVSSSEELLGLLHACDVDRPPCVRRWRHSRVGRGVARRSAHAVARSVARPEVTVLSSTAATTTEVTRTRPARTQRTG